MQNYNVKQSYGFVRNDKGPFQFSGTSPIIKRKIYTLIPHTHDFSDIAERLEINIIFLLKIYK